MPRARRKSKPSKKATLMADGCIIPPHVKDEALNQFKFDAGNEHEADGIAKYVEWQCQKDAERVTYLEKLRTENVFGADYDCWNVRTDKERYWVITHPTNLYSQELFPSLDYTLSFHIGLMARVQSQRKGANEERVGDRLAAGIASDNDPQQNLSCYAQAAESSVTSECT